MMRLGKKIIFIKFQTNSNKTISVNTSALESTEAYTEIITDGKKLMKTISDCKRIEPILMQISMFIGRYSCLGLQFTQVNKLNDNIL